MKAKMKGKRTYTIIAIGATINLIFAVLASLPATAKYSWAFGSQIQSALTLFTLAALGYLKHDDIAKVGKYFIQKDEAAKQDKPEEDKSEEDKSEDASKE